MFQNKLQAQVVLIALAIFFVIMLQVGVLQTPPYILILILMTLAVFFTAFLKTDLALAILIFSMLLSPEIGGGGVGQGGRSVVVRLDDLFIFMLFFGWLARMAVNKELGFLRVTPLNKPVLFYLAICLLASVFGVATGTIAFKYSVFYYLKYLEYFLLFFMVSNNIHSRKQVYAFLSCMFVVCAVVCLFAWFLHLSGAARVTAPFEGKHGEPNTLGGYLVLMMMVATGLMLNIRTMKTKVLLGGVLFLSLPALAFSLSRSSWVALVVGYLALIFISQKGKGILIITGILSVVFFSVIVPKAVQDRIDYTFQSQTHRKVLGKEFAIDESTAERVDTWEKGLAKLSKRPFLGYGVGGGGAVVDNQYSRLLIESGILGAGAFIFMIFVLFKNCFLMLKRFTDDEFVVGMVSGFTAGLVGLLVHSLGAATFIVIRIMEPFWFLTAIVLALPEIASESPDTELEENVSS